jgi:cellulase/cellobiase CelA1
MRIFLNNTKCSGSGKSDGFSLVEALLAVALFALFSYGLATAYFYGQEASVLAGERARAVLYAQEGIEAVRSIRGDDFVNLEDGTFGLEIIPGQWELSGNSDTDDIFNREIDISSETDDIKQISSTVTWQQNKQRDGEVLLVSRLTSWQKSAGSSPLITSSQTSSEWGSGYCYLFSITNTSSGVVTAWELTFDVTQFSIYTTWDGNYSLLNGVYTVTPKNYNSQIPPGGTVDNIGYCANKTGNPFLPENIQATIPEEPEEDLSYEVLLTSEWGSGYCADIEITNNGDEAASTWETFIELNDSSIYDTWNADYTFVSGGVYQVTPLSWNGNVDPGETIDSPGFCANKTGPNFAPNITEEP